MKIKRWNVRKNEPALVGKGVEVFVDGVLINAVRAFDIDLGEVVALCASGRREGHPTYHHPDPDDSLGEPCEETFQGTVRIEMPTP